MKKIFFTVAMFSLVVMISIPVFVNAQRGVLAPKPGDPTYTTQLLTSGGTNASVVTQSGASPNATPSGCVNLVNGGLGGVVGCVLTIFNYAITLMIAGAVVMVIWGAFIMITSEEKRAEGRQTIIYGIIGIFVMISVWGFVNILDKTFNLRSNPISPPRLTN
ncbi:MAG: pilin [bacterium]|nr:pilin [bacterium]